MSAARIGTTSVRSYNPVVATGECSLCATKEISLYRLHRPRYGEVYDSAKHGPLQIEAGRLGFKIPITTEEIVAEGAAEKTATIGISIFQRVGTDPEADDHVRLFTDEHASCSECIRRMMSASQALKCPFCRIPIPKDTIHLPPVAAAARSAAEAEAPAIGGAGRAESRRREGTSYRDAAASPPNEHSRIEDVLFQTGGRIARHRGQGRFPPQIPPSPVSDETRTSQGRQRPPRHPIGLDDMRRVFGNGSDDEGLEYPPRDPSAETFLSTLNRQNRRAIQRLMREDGLDDRGFFLLQQSAIPSNLSGSSAFHAAGSRGVEDPEGQDSSFRAIGSNPRPSGSRSAPSIIGSAAVAAPSIPPPPLIPRLSLALSSHPLIAELHCDPAMLDEALATSLIANEENVRLLLSNRVPFTVIHENRGWIFSQFFAFNPSEAIIPQMAITQRHEERSLLAKLYKQTVTYARFALLAEGEHKLSLESEIRETLSSLSEEDRHLIEEWIWRENGAPLTLDSTWGKNNTFHSAIALYSAIYKAIHMKLLALSAAERIALISRCEGDTTNICKLADSFM